MVQVKFSIKHQLFLKTIINMISNTIVFLVFLVVACYAIHVAKSETHIIHLPAESFNSDKKSYKRCSELEIPFVEKKIMDLFQKTENEDWDIYYPCGYTNAQEELDKNNNFLNKTKGWVMTIKGIDNFAAKDRLWNLFQNHYGRLRAQIYTPQTWVTYDDAQINDFYKFAKMNPKNLYIMKKNIQRQEGLHIFTDPLLAKSAYSNNYVVIQKILQDPFLINQRKINIRVYILITCKNKHKTLHVYKNGFIYYSKELFKTGNTRDEIITTGYVERNVYKENPLTLFDLYNYLEKSYQKGSSRKFVENIHFVLKGLMDASQKSFCGVDNNVMYCQMYGVDLQPNKDLSDVKIIEINKGMDLGVKDTRDGKVKEKLIRDMYNTLGITKTSEHNDFEKVWQN